MLLLGTMVAEVTALETTLVGDVAETLEVAVTLAKMGSKELVGPPAENVEIAAVILETVLLLAIEVGAGAEGVVKLNDGEVVEAIDDVQLLEIGDGLDPNPVGEDTALDMVKLAEAGFDAGVVGSLAAVLLPVAVGGEVTTETTLSIAVAAVDTIGSRIPVALTLVTGGGNEVCAGPVGVEASVVRNVVGVPELVEVILVRLLEAAPVLLMVLTASLVVLFHPAD